MKIKIKYTAQNFIKDKIFAPDSIKLINFFASLRFSNKIKYNGKRKGARNKTNMYVYFKMQENQKFSAGEIGIDCKFKAEIFIPGQF
ncbi:hypothetical protein C1634_007790 [Chryseobacterium viscerum]|uniref:Uncharacterized protein n=1 Tax=Chryseobacterium viscerum TaxID=1037377 RepID=A0A316WMN4_9FLAO|nr:hypothetical protein C1634_007790 [Chryseobacterium viscerum]